LAPRLRVCGVRRNRAHFGLRRSQGLVELGLRLLRKYALLHLEQALHLLHVNARIRCGPLNDLNQCGSFWLRLVLNDCAHEYLLIRLSRICARFARLRRYSARLTTWSGCAAWNSAKLRCARASF